MASSSAVGRHSPDLDRPDMNLTRIVLLGKSGVGKSAAGNTILGQEVFKSQMRSCSVTRECSENHGNVSGRNVSVVDTPGFFDTDMNHEDLVTEIARSVYECSPGPHTFLIVFPVYMRFTSQEEQIPQQIETLFGEEVLKYSIILFTHGDLLRGKSIEEFIQENSKLRSVVDQCGGGYHVFNNEDQNNRDQVTELLQKIDTMIQQNGGGHYTNQMYQDAQRFKQEEEEEIIIQESNCGFLQFLLKFWDDIYVKMAAAGLVIGGVVGGAVTGTVQGAAVGAVAGPIGVVVIAGAVVKAMIYAAFVRRNLHRSRQNQKWE